MFINNLNLPNLFTQVVFKVKAKKTISFLTDIDTVLQLSMIIIKW
jgi:hypothetical protein